MLGGLFTRIAQFWLGSFGVEIIASVIAIYAFEYFEPAWGRDASLQVSMWVGMLVATISAAGFGIGMRIFGKQPTRLWCILSGAIIATATLAADAIVRERSALYETAILVAALMLPLVAAYFARGGDARV